MQETRTKTSKKKLVIAITGASGALFGLKALEMAGRAGVETHLILSRAGERTLVEETGVSVTQARTYADVVYPVADIGAAIASGSFDTDGMLVAPCSVKTMSEIATGVTSNLVSRAADVTLKERRPLVLMVRETPLHTGHLRTMTALSEMGAIIMPPVPAFYTQPVSLDDIAAQLVARALSLFGIDVAELKRWQGQARS